MARDSPDFSECEVAGGAEPLPTQNARTGSPWRLCGFCAVPFPETPHPQLNEVCARM